MLRHVRGEPRWRVLLVGHDRNLRVTLEACEEPLARAAVKREDDGVVPLEPSAREGPLDGTRLGNHLDVLGSDYVRTAAAKGLADRVVVLKHALRNALIPVVTVAGLQIGILLGGTVVVEEVFTLPGIGRLVLWSIYQRDYPLTQSTILFIAVLFMAINLAVDLLYGYLDPRIRYSR